MTDCGSRPDCSCYADERSDVGVVDLAPQILHQVAVDGAETLKRLMSQRKCRERVDKSVSI